MKKFIILFILFLLYLFLSNYFQIYIPCPFYKLTGFYCPGCGITRMFISILQFDFYSAFRYNPLLFLLLPFALYLFIDYLIRKENSLFKKIPDMVWYILLFVFIIYGILRNIPYFSFLAPN